MNERYTTREQLEANDYELTIPRLKLAADANREALEAFKTEMSGITLREAATSDELAGFIPQLFTDEILLLGQREAIARNNFTVVGQASNTNFTVRYRSKNDCAQIVKELDEIKYSTSERSTKTFSFNKICDFYLASYELLMDSPLNEVTDNVALSMSKIYRRENQLMWNMLTRHSQGSIDGEGRNEWDNWIPGPDCEDPYVATAEAIMDAMETAYIDMTARLTDRFDPTSMRWFMSPTIFAILWQHSTFRRYDLAGTSPVLLTGNLPAPYGIPYSIMEPGYFDTTSNWNAEPCDIYLCALPYCAAIRERVALRTEPISLPLNQSSGPLLWERLTPYVKNGFAYRRISPNPDYATQIVDNADLKITVQDDD